MCAAVECAHESSPTYTRSIKPLLLRQKEWEQNNNKYNNNKMLLVLLFLLGLCELYSIHIHNLTMVLFILLWFFFLEVIK